MKLKQLYYESMLQPTLRETRTDIPGLNDLLNSGISFVIVGAIARNIYSNRPRNTQDVDVLTTDYNKLAQYVRATYPHLEMKQNNVVIRFSYEGKELIDIMIPYNKFFESILHDINKVGKFNVASPEALLSMKFAAIMSQHRSRENKYQDRGDMASIMIKTQIDMEKAKHHLALLYPEAPNEFVAFVTKIKEDFAI